jgi:uncharacterized iron-regulated protein
MIIFSTLIILLSIHGCASVKKKPTPTMATLPGVSDQFKIGQIIDVSAGKVISFEEFINRIATKELIFVGEVHDNPEHHLIQVQILQALIAKTGQRDLAMEFFQHSDQPALDRYIQGETDEGVFLEEVGWKKGWGFDYSFYRPLMLLARQNGSRVLAINAPKDIVRKVARKGLEGLDQSERDQIAREIGLDNEGHRAYLREVYGQHGHGSLKQFEYFYEAQCVWEDTMAQNIADFLIKEEGKMIVFTGNGHIVNKYGIPDRAVKRHPVSMVTVMPYAIHGTETLEKGMADYVWLTPSYPHRRRSFI